MLIFFILQFIKGGSFDYVRDKVVVPQRISLAHPYYELNNSYFNKMSSANQPTFYQVLNLSPDATPAEIRKAYLKLSLKYHPDKNPDNQEEAKEQFVKIGQAYDVLSDPIKKRQYDREIASGRLFSPSSFFGGGMNTSNDNTDNSGYSTTSGFSAQEEGYEQTYESYRQAFDEHMASLSPDELNSLKNIASVIGSIVGSVYGSKLGSKLGGNSKLGRALGESVGTLVGSLAGSQAGTGFVDGLHNDSVKRVIYEENKRVQRGKR